MKLLELEQQYRDLLAEETAEEKAAEEKRLAQQSAILTDVRAQAIAALVEKEDLDAEELSSVLSVEMFDWADDLDEPAFETLGNFVITLSPPQHADITLPHNQAHKSDGHISLQLSGYRNPWYVRNTSYACFEAALLVAARTWQEEQAAERDYAEQKAERAEHERSRAEAKALQEQQRAHLIDELMRDPVAFRLLQAMVEHVREREAWQEQLDNTNDYLAEMETSYGARLGRAEQSARDAQREAENARYEANEARDDATRIQRKLQQVERGW